MKSAQVTVLSDVDTATVTGAAFDVNQIVSASFQPVFGDVTANGTVKIQGSNDNPAPSGKGINGNFIPTNWADIPSATSAISSGVGPMIVLANMCYRSIRVVYTRSSGGSTTVQVLATFLSV